MSDEPEIWVTVPEAAAKKEISVAAIRKAILANRVKTSEPAPVEGTRPRGGQVAQLVWWPDVAAMRGRGGLNPGTDPFSRTGRTDTQRATSKANGTKGGRPRKPSAPDAT